jgi:hypothetical protein
MAKKGYYQMAIDIAICKHELKDPAHAFGVDAYTSGRSFFFAPA